MTITELYSLYLDCGMRVSTDSRRISGGEMFIALKGDHFNGNLFAERALEQGASYVIVDEGGFEDKRIIQVENGLKCLQQLSRFHRQTIKPRLIGIGGSNGKTTTKELLVSVLGTEYNVHSTRGNLNNHIGVPLTLLELRREHQISVIEMGANKEGDISELCEIAEPELGLITNIGKEHLQGFGSMEGVARSEGELFDYINKIDGHAFVNKDDAWIASMSQGLNSKSEYGIKNSQLEQIELSPKITFRYMGISVKSPLMGEHNLQNILAAIAVAEFFHIKAEHICKGIELYTPQNNRSQWIETTTGNSVLLDAYNANPSSVEMALKTFNTMIGNRMVILGDMFELGAFEAEEHQAIASMCEKMAFEKVYLVGQAFSQTLTVSPNVEKFVTKDSLVKSLKGKNTKGTKVLIKGSRGMKMEDLLELF